MINNEMAATQTTVVPVRHSTLSPTLVLVAGWLVPGLGHLLLKKPIRAALLFVSVVSMFAIGMALHGKIYAATNGDMLDLLGFVGQMGSPLLYVVAHAAGAAPLCCLTRFQITAASCRSRWPAERDGCSGRYVPGERPKGGPVRCRIFPRCWCMRCLPLWCSASRSVQSQR